MDGEREADAERGFLLDDRISPPPMALWVLLTFAMGDDIKPLLAVLSLGLSPPGIPLSLSSTKLPLPFRLSESLPVLSPSLPLYAALFAEGAIEGVCPFASMRVTSGMTALEVRRLLLLLGG